MANTHNKNLKFHLFYKKPVYYVWFYDDKTGKRSQRSLKTKDKIEATELTKAINTDAMRQNLGNANFVVQFNDRLNQLECRYVKPLLRVFRQEFLQHRANVKKCSQSVMAAYNMLYAIVKEFKLEWDDLNDVEVLLNFQERVRGKCAQTTFERRMTYFRVFIKWAFQSNYITQEIYNKVNANLVKENFHRSQKAKTLITPRDFDIILCKAKQEDKDFYWYLVFLYLLNGREGELIKLRREDIKLQGGDIALYQNKTQFVKQIRLANPIIQDFDAYLSEKGIGTQDYVFDGAKKNDKYYYLLYRDYKTSLRLNKDYQLGQIRHFTATAVNDRFDKETAGLYLGHSWYHDTTSRYICSEITTTFKVSCYLCGKVDSLKHYVKDVKPVKVAELADELQKKSKVS